MNETIQIYHFSTERKFTMSKRGITGNMRARLAEVGKRGKVFALRVGVRANILVGRRRLRRAFSELGENMYGEMVAGRAKGWEDAPGMSNFKIRIEGLKVEIHQQEEKLTEIMTEEEKVPVETKPEKAAAEGDKASPKEVASSKPAK
jgi:hypothetical protein